MTKDNWIKAFDEMELINDLINEYTTPDEAQKIVDSLKSFISQVEKDAIEKTNKRWRERIGGSYEDTNKPDSVRIGVGIIHKEWRMGYNQALQDLLEGNQ